MENKSRRPVWRCLLSKSVCTEYCTLRGYAKPDQCPYSKSKITPVWERYEGREGQRHFDGGI